MARNGADDLERERHAVVVHAVAEHPGTEVVPVGDRALLRAPEEKELQSARALWRSGEKKLQSPDLQSLGAVAASELRTSSSRR